MSTYRDVSAGDGRSRLPIVLKSAGAGACAGAAAVYLLDPARGRARRARVRDQAAHATHEVRDGAGVLSRDLGNRGRGAGAALRYQVSGRSADDRVLTERIRAELGRHVSHPHAVHVTVEDHVVTLDGDLLAGEEERARKAVRRIPGVKSVVARWTPHLDPTGVPTLQGPGRPREPVPELLQQRWSPTARFMAGVAAAYALTAARRLPGPLSWVVRTAGVAVAARALTNLPLRRLTGVNAGRSAVDVAEAVEIAAPSEAIWELVSDYSVFARVMPDVYEVRRSPDGELSHWMIKGPAGVPIRFDATETKRDEGKEIAWKSTEGQLIAHTGSLRLVDRGRGRTRVQVRLTYNPVVGAAGHAIARLLGADPGHKLRQDLARLKQHVEGEHRRRSVRGERPVTVGT
ncbi:SRPBCC family protein [Nonomuraea sp. NPDC049421]|uniref:SRPBCC family protein n=1 Tax=Nonomuraea sp. NPDC049421 TaxID=3155275 RepID=UPI003448DFB4